MSELKLQQCRLDNRYDLIKCLGRGSYAEVYMALDIAARSGSPQTIVIKALNTSLQGEADPDLERTLIENFQNEAVALDRVRHPRIISRLGHGTAIDLDGTTFHYIVLEYLSGGDLASLCRHHPLDLTTALGYIEQVCEGLSYAHVCGVIHRDIKPQNLLLTADRKRVKIADFGVAKIKFIEAAEGLITRVGTDVYAAPEHHPFARTGPLDPSILKRGAQLNLGPAADIYSLAKTVYVLLTGEAPRRFAGKPLTEFPENIAREPWADRVLGVLRRATETDPDKRHQSVPEFWINLHASATNVVSINEIENEAITRPLSRNVVAAAQQALLTPPSPSPQFEKARPSAHPRVEVYARPRIVVPVATQEPDGIQTAANRRVGAPSDSPRGSVPGPSSSLLHNLLFGERIRRWLLVLLIFTAFAAALLATHAFVSRQRRGAAARSEATNRTSLIGREFVTTTDVNLRSGPSPTEARVGLAEKGSRGRVRSVRGNWYEVEILEHARPKEDPASADRGWLNGTHIRMQSL